MPKKLHHFVSRSYLRSWAQDDQIWCLQAGEIFRTNVRNVAAENHFYRLRDLLPDDLNFIREEAIKDSPERLKASHEDLLQRFASPYIAKKQLEKSGKGTPELFAAIERDIAEANENFHGSIEQSFQPYLEQLRKGNLNFLQNDSDAVQFYRGLAVQYVRTNHRRRSQLMFSRENLARYERTANVLTHILALNVGYSLFVDHPRLRLHLLENQSSARFITADQPAINLAARLNDISPPVHFEVYYPVSPTRAVLLLRQDSEFEPRRLQVTSAEADLYNIRIASRSYRQIFASRKEDLEPVRRFLPAFIESH